LGKRSTNIDLSTMVCTKVVWDAIFNWLGCNPTFGGVEVDNIASFNSLVKEEK